MYASLLSFPLFFWSILCSHEFLYLLQPATASRETQACNTSKSFLKISFLFLFFFYFFWMVFSSCRQKFSSYLQWVHTVSELHLAFCPCLTQPHKYNARVNTPRSTQLITFGRTGINICPSYALSALCWRILYGLPGSLRWWAGFKMFLFLVVNCLFQSFLW